MEFMEAGEEVQFVREELSRPVTDYINLVSSDEEHPSSPPGGGNVKPKDYVDYQKERAKSTLDRLARHVELQKQQKEEKNKAFQEKVDLQQAHGLQELEFIKGRTSTEEARQCVNHWANKPALKLGTVNPGRSVLFKRRQQWPVNSPILCPVMHCNRKFDNKSLLLGHLQRFDHSPCDPTVTLHGPPSNGYACAVCFNTFVSQQQYNNHLLTKVGLADGHQRNLAPQIIQCFACPNCFLLFNIQDDCLQHMSIENHFLQHFNLNGEKRTSFPLPFPSYAKKVLISLCKEVSYQVYCATCHHILVSHIDLTSHFRICCRDAGPIARAEKNISQIAEVFKMKGYCTNCNQLFNDEHQVNEHAQVNGHNVRIISTMEESILMFCYINELNKNPPDVHRTVGQSGLKISPLKRASSSSGSSTIQQNRTVVKRKKDSDIKEQGNGLCVGQESKLTTDSTKTAWFCECSQKFLTEPAAEKHILIANSICHKCVVCGKLAEDLGVIRLHMSRFHGGAHLTNYFFWCRACNTEMPRKESIMAHVTERHAGHSFYFEQEVLEDEPSPSSVTLEQNAPKWMDSSDLPPSLDDSARGHWQCRVCEEMFDSEDSIQQHCRSLGSHQFHRYSCGRCMKRFHKVETLYRHCQDHHDSEIMVKYFCGLCDDLVFDEEVEFSNHFEMFHSKDYVFVPEQTEASIKNPVGSSVALLENVMRLSCGCLDNYTSKVNRKEDYSQCQQNLLNKGNLWYRCCSCPATTQKIEDMEDHLSKKHRENGSNPEEYVVKCGTCGRAFSDIEAAQQHYHGKHCFLQKPSVTNHFGTSEPSTSVFKFTASGACVSKKRSTKTTLKTTSKAQVNDLCVSNNILEPHSRSATDITKENENKTSLPMDTDEMEDESKENSELPDLDLLRTMTHIVFVDLDNWANFFTRLPGHLNQGTFVWGFKGGKTGWKPPVNCPVFKHLVNIGSFFLHPQCSDRKDAADFAICMHAGRMDEQLPKQIPFTILSGDKGFLELESQFKKTQRPAHILNPHNIEEEMMCALLNSIADTTKGRVMNIGDSCPMEVMEAFEAVTVFEFKKVWDDDEDLIMTIDRSIQENKMEIEENQQNEDAELQEAIRRSLKEI
ncbi:LOW QUALITY PROTEIN: E3 SUMO-protein ligase ZNF451 [Rhinatrema bivittatum]|uniref:LOW QUALITY PROTEIN: E3 SUMO-protein ligase ZNF451 n=1 Tax=Rhinatrema bivittatum TaxID=194408 RepID=UPI00112CCA74|nr:LOW QUALITY PROTEIN: E3 SUMO-protein ligase ZNF451 [Rhinatrema bivittatum]